MVRMFGNLMSYSRVEICNLVPRLEIFNPFV